MRILFWIGIFIFLTGCMDNELSYISIRNDTGIPIYALPYTAEYTSGEWIQPGFTGEFYSINSDCLDAFDYFSFYYDSLIVYIKDYDDKPVKFYKNGKTVNYDPTLNPFTNRDMWLSQEFEQDLPGTGLESTERTHILEHFFSIESENVKSLGDTLHFRLNPAS